MRTLWGWSFPKAQYWTYWFSIYFELYLLFCKQHREYLPLRWRLYQICLALGTEIGWRSHKQQTSLPIHLFGDNDMEANTTIFQGVLCSSGQYQTSTQLQVHGSRLELRRIGTYDWVKFQWSCWLAMSSHISIKLMSIFRISSLKKLLIEIQALVNSFDPNSELNYIRFETSAI